MQVTAIATDPSGETDLIQVTIHVLDVAEKPEVRGPSALTYFENQTVDAAPTFCYSETPPEQTVWNLTPICLPL